MTSFLGNLNPCYLNLIQWLLSWEITNLNLQFAVTRWQFHIVRILNFSIKSLFLAKHLLLSAAIRLPLEALAAIQTWTANCKCDCKTVVMWHPQVCCLTLTMKNLMLKVSNKSHSQLKIQKLFLFSNCHQWIKLKVYKITMKSLSCFWQIRRWLVVVLEKV